MKEARNIKKESSSSNGIFTLFHINQFSFCFLKSWLLFSCLTLLHITWLWNRGRIMDGFDSEFCIDTRSTTSDVEDA